MTVAELKRKLLARTESTDARIIITLATGLDAIAQITKSRRNVTAEEEAKAMNFLNERLSGTPMAYITGEKEFYGHSFHVTPSVLIPRPDTETLVEKAVEIAKNFPCPRILDLCTGSGAIAASVSYALSMPVAISDISPDALAIARENYRIITGKEAEWREGDLLNPWKGEHFDMILSNPPYLTASWYEETDSCVKSEPEIAFLGGGNDGLDIIRKIIATSPDILNKGGYLMLEIDYRQSEICGSLLEKSGFSEISVLRDLAGKERVIYGRLSK